ncbi:MAG: hypothetical protein AAF902_09530 [Chloroflexota bacterium]
MEKLPTKMRELYWRVFVNTNDSEKAKVIRNSIFRELKNCELVSCKAYWKDNSLYELEFKQKLEEQESSKIIIEVFSKVILFSTSWMIDIPTSFKVENFELSGLVDSGIKFNGVKWISFMLQDVIE